MTQIFVSYSKKDRDLAVRFVGRLRKQGFSLWWDEDLTHHASWNDLIKQNLDEAGFVVVLWTENSVQSDWVRSEAYYAARKKKLVQISIDECEVPLGLDQIQYLKIDGHLPEGSPGWSKLISWISGQPQQEFDDDGYPDPHWGPADIEAALGAGDASILITQYDHADDIAEALAEFVLERFPDQTLSRDKIDQVLLYSQPPFEILYFIPRTDAEAMAKLLMSRNVRCHINQNETYPYEEVSDDLLTTRGSQLSRASCIGFLILPLLLVALLLTSIFYN